MTVYGKVLVDDVQSSVVISAGAEVAVPSVECKKKFGVVLRRLIFRLDVEETKLSGVSAALQITSSGAMTVIPAGSRRARNEGVPVCAVRWNERSAFFHRSIHLSKIGRAHV